MSYLGQVELKSSEIRRIDVTGSTSATHTLTWTPPSEQSLIITINGVKQQNNYSFSGTTLTLDTALVATDAMEVIGILDIGEAVTPPDDSISTIKIQDDAVTAAKLANSINTEITANTAKVTNATHTGDVTGATALTIATDAVDIAMLSATGVASATTFLRGDNAWAAAGGNNTPAFQAYLGSDQAISHDSTVKVTFDTEDFDTDSAYDNTTNYRFTVPVGEGGKYFCYATMQVEGPSQGTYNFGYGDIYKNGSIYFGSKWNERNNPSEVAWMTNYGIIDLAEGDYIECFAYMTTTTAGAGLIKNYGRWTRFGAYKMIGL
tara:strand:- start:110 stop:1069 length:960 start_codon:yes stop_codon:yes gene_type:complete